MKWDFCVARYRPALEGESPFPLIQNIPAATPEDVPLFLPTVDDVNELNFNRAIQPFNHILIWRNKQRRLMIINHKPWLRPARLVHMTDLRVIHWYTTRLFRLTKISRKLRRFC